MSLRIGCAGWSIGRDIGDRFQSEGTHLERYSALFNAVEINSSFYRPHRTQTYARWSMSTPANFKFAVKVSKTITHDRRLLEIDSELARFLGEVQYLGSKLGPLLFQLPPSLPFDFRTAEACFSRLRSLFAAAVVCEPRHPTWFSAEAEIMFKSLDISRAGADPAVVPEAARPAGSPRLRYLRMHGAPRTYYSSYDRTFLHTLRESLRSYAAADSAVWCIFDNTAAGAALENALELLEQLQFHPTG